MTMTLLSSLLCIAVAAVAAQYPTTTAQQETTVIETTVATSTLIPAQTTTAVYAESTRLREPNWCGADSSGCCEKQYSTADPCANCIKSGCYIYTYDGGIDKCVAEVTVPLGSTGLIVDVKSCPAVPTTRQAATVGAPAGGVCADEECCKKHQSADRQCVACTTDSSCSYFAIVTDNVVTDGGLCRWAGNRDRDMLGAGFYKIETAAACPDPCSKRDCGTCLNKAGCAWCGSSCQFKSCPNGGAATTTCSSDAATTTLLASVTLLAIIMAIA